MKSIKSIAIAVLLLGTTAWAYEQPENPDRKVSFGVNYDHQGLNSEYKFGGFTMKDFVKVSGDTFIADVRVPVSSILTFQVHGGYLGQKNTTFASEEIKYGGYSVGAGVRFYIQ